MACKRFHVDNYIIYRYASDHFDASDQMIGIIFGVFPLALVTFSPVASLLLKMTGRSYTLMIGGETKRLALLLLLLLLNITIYYDIVYNILSIRIYIMIISK